MKPHHPRKAFPNSCVCQCRCPKTRTTQGQITIHMYSRLPTYIDFESSGAQEWTLPGYDKGTPSTPVRLLHIPQPARLWASQESYSLCTVIRENRGDLPSPFLWLILAATFGGLGPTGFVKLAKLLQRLSTSRSEEVD
ncbi:hypothetical protein M752DRAFT_311515 [Aspergillus phoenicis ATCC 13157]|uniref:Uncharacterized protein n=1 Tax=Aspergillus phoenicis ATCC 13157 TaxID=1353007 RepID=A0A370PTB3_ASPPH|nr:hypothetical protein M752DRAFT_311515 [Aspergillus phoenicis ATCC 13157]